MRSDAYLDPTCYSNGILHNRNYNVRGNNCNGMLTILGIHILKNPAPQVPKPLIQIGNMVK